VHLALCIGDWQKQAAPLVRAHSSCVTGDILGSLRCDCGDQLHLALDLMKKEGSGILLYLHQEGRGIGISSKLRAYKLQEQGLDTFAANTQLGYHEDERDFSIAAVMLTALGISHIRLLTNNPEKLASFEESNITITQRVPLIAATGEHNANYIDAKAKKHGHLF
jgi:GTP cyclohydrolase II